MLLKRGAEAELRRTTYLGREAVEKSRVPKGYRLPALDEGLRRGRIRTEARLMGEARTAGVAVPILYDIDLAENKLVMEFVDGPTAKAVLDKGGKPALAVCRKIGEAIARLHVADIVHGDLTTSNMILRDGRLVMIDFSLGERTRSVESKGVDLRLLKEALTSAHARGPEYFEAVARAYRRRYPKAAEVLAKVTEIEERGRYT
ncbi:MAG TPA: KEOPS complex kinase/ATPase Bud32 [Thermoplasmata archaeon]